MNEYENATVEDLLAEALDAWRGLSGTVHGDRCAHNGGLEVCDPSLLAAEHRATQLGIHFLHATPQ